MRKKKGAPGRGEEGGNWWRILGLLRRWLLLRRLASRLL